MEDNKQKEGVMCRRGEEYTMERIVRLLQLAVGVISSGSCQTKEMASCSVLHCEVEKQDRFEFAL